MGPFCIYICFPRMVHNKIVALSTGHSCLPAVYLQSSFCSWRTLAVHDYIALTLELHYAPFEYTCTVKYDGKHIYTHAKLWCCNSYKMQCAICKVIRGWNTMCSRQRLLDPEFCTTANFRDSFDRYIDSKDDSSMALMYSVSLQYINEENLE